MQTEKYQRKTMVIDATRVTAENMTQVARWCQGEIKTTDPVIAEQLGRKGQEETFIKIDSVRNPVNEKQTTAFVGDWVIFIVGTFKVYADKTFRRDFEPAFQEPKKPTPASMGQSKAPTGRDPGGITIAEMFNRMDELFRSYFGERPDPEAAENQFTTGGEGVVGGIVLDEEIEQHHKEAMAAALDTQDSLLDEIDAETTIAEMQAQGIPIDPEPAAVFDPAEEKSLEDPDTVVDG